jgi:hypothetical protein
MKHKRMNKPGIKDRFPYSSLYIYTHGLSSICAAVCDFFFVKYFFYSDGIFSFAFDFIQKILLFF